MLLKIERTHGFTRTYYELSKKVGWHWAYVTSGGREDILNKIRDFLMDPIYVDTSRVKMADVEGLIPKGAEDA